jgi:hypothetical protein
MREICLSILEDEHGVQSVLDPHDQAEINVPFRVMNPPRLFLAITNTKTLLQKEIRRGQI